MTVMEEKKRYKTNEEHEWIVEMLQKLVRPEYLKNNWAKEYKILKRLIKEHPNKKIWVNIPFQVRSLIFFLTPRGKNELIKIKNSVTYVVRHNKHVELEKDNVGEDIIVNKLLSIKDFLKKYNKK